MSESHAQTHVQVDPELRLWLVLIGAMLVSEKVRSEAGRLLPIDDVPQGYRDLWGCIVNVDGPGVRTCVSGWQVEPGHATVLNGIIRKLQEIGVSKFVKSAAYRLQMTGGVDAQQLRDVMGMMLSRLDAREAAFIQKPADGQNPEKK